MLPAMKPLTHPALQDITVEGILHALSDPVRVAIYVGIIKAACAHSCASLLTVCDRPIPKSTLSQHFKALREAGLIRGERHGVEMRNRSRCAEVDQRFPGLIAAILQAHSLQIAERHHGTTPKRKPGSRGAARPAS